VGREKGRKERKECTDPKRWARPSGRRQKKGAFVGRGEKRKGKERVVARREYGHLRREGGRSRRGGERRGPFAVALPERGGKAGDYGRGERGRGFHFGCGKGKRTEGGDLERKMRKSREKGKESARLPFLFILLGEREKKVGRACLVLGLVGGRPRGQLRKQELLCYPLFLLSAVIKEEEGRAKKSLGDSASHLIKRNKRKSGEGGRLILLPAYRGEGCLSKIHPARE